MGQQTLPPFFQQTLPPFFQQAPERQRWIFYIDRTGDFYPPAAAQLGVPLGQLLVVRVTRPTEVLWVCEQALRCRAVAAVIAPLPSIDSYASRRLQLAAEAGGGLGLLILEADLACPAGCNARGGLQMEEDSSVASLARNDRLAATLARNDAPDMRRFGGHTFAATRLRLQTLKGKREVISPWRWERPDQNPSRRARGIGPAPGAPASEQSRNFAPLDHSTQSGSFALRNTEGCLIEVTVLKVREGKPPEPFILEVPDAPGDVSASALAVDGARAPRWGTGLQTGLETGQEIRPPRRTGDVG
jgi:cell division inhibitor SulA